MTPTDDERSLRLACTACAATTLCTLPLATLRVTRQGEFQPVACPRCGAHKASPTVRPWRLTYTDRQWLRKLRIAADDPDANAGKDRDR